MVKVLLSITALIQSLNCSLLLKCDGSFNSNTHVDAKMSDTSSTLTSTQPGLRAAVVDLHPVTKHRNWHSTSFFALLINSKSISTTFFTDGVLASGNLRSDVTNFAFISLSL